MAENFVQPTDSREEMQRKINSINNYYIGQDYYNPEQTIGFIETSPYYLYMLGLEHVDAVLNQNNEVLDYVYTDPAQGTGTDDNIGDNKDSNTVGSTADTSFKIKIPANPNVKTEDNTLEPRSGVATDSENSNKTGIYFPLDVALFNALTSNFLGKIFGSDLYTDDPGILSAQSVVATMGDTAKQYLTKAGNVALYNLVDAEGKIKTFVDGNILAFFTQFQHKKALLGQRVDISYPTQESNPGNEFIVTNYVSLAALYNSAIENNTLKYNISDNIASSVITDFISNHLHTASFMRIMDEPFTKDVTFSAMNCITIYCQNDSPSIGETVTGNWNNLGLFAETKKRTGYDVLFIYCRIKVTNKNVEYCDIINASVQNRPTLSNPLYIGSATIYNTGAAGAGEHDYSNVNGTSRYTGRKGVTNQPNATIFNDTITDDDTPETVLPKLKDQYPDVFSDDNTLVKSVVQPDGSIKEIKLVQVPYPVYDGTPEQPTTSEVIKYVNQTTPAPDVSTLPDDLLDKINKTLGDKPETGAISGGTGTGTTPDAPLPSQSASALWRWYNPTTENLDALGAYLWSTDFLENLKKLMIDPMQAVIGLKKIYMTPHTAGAENIKIGFLDSGVSAPVCDTQYVTTVCGKVDVREYFGNVLDYSPYTKISLYLPFIGIIPLNPADVMRSTLQVIYKGDIVNGCCIAEVHVWRDGVGGTIYTYTGNMACEYPLTAGSYTGIISSVFSAGAAAVSGLSSGLGFNPLGVLTGAASSALNSLAGGNMLNVQQSGSFAGTAGAMANKKPYLIISRPQSEINAGFPALQGYPSNVFTTLSSCKGYTKVKAVHVDAVPSATQEEKEMIESALKSGVIIG